MSGRPLNSARADDTPRGAFEREVSAPRHRRRVCHEHLGRRRSDRDRCRLVRREREVVLHCARGRFTREAIGGVTIQGKQGKLRHV